MQLIKSEQIKAEENQSTDKKIKKDDQSGAPEPQKQIAGIRRIDSLVSIQQENSRVYQEWYRRPKFADMKRRRDEMVVEDSDEDDELYEGNSIISNLHQL